MAMVDGRAPPATPRGDHPSGHDRRSDWSVTSRSIEEDKRESRKCSSEPLAEGTAVGGASDLGKLCSGARRLPASTQLLPLLE